MYMCVNDCHQMKSALNRTIGVRRGFKNGCIYKGSSEYFTTGGLKGDPLPLGNGSVIVDDAGSYFYIDLDIGNFIELDAYINQKLGSLLSI